MRKYNLAAGDFPDIDDFRSKLQEMDFSKFHSLKPRLMDEVEQALTIDIPRLLESLPRDPTRTTEPEVAANAPLVYENPPPLKSAASSRAVGGWATEEDSNPFGDDDTEWALAEFMESCKPRFDAAQSNGFISGASAKTILTQSSVPKSALKKIWDLSDRDKDGQLDIYEFTLAMYYCDIAKQGREVPNELDPTMIPPNKT